MNETSNIQLTVIQGDKMKNRIAILMVVAVVFVMALSACSVVNEITTVSDVGNAFMTALRDGDNATSWAMLTTDVQTEVGGEAAWAEFTAPRNFSKWKFSNTEFENDVAQMDGEATLVDETYTIVLVFDKVNDSWLVSGINITFKE